MMKFFVILSLLFLTPIFLRAQSVDILWQGETYTPPFYLGKSLWSKESTITLVAMPTGLGSASNLNYRWIRNGTVLGNASGIGRSSISYTDSILSRPQEIRLEIVSGQNVAASNSIIIVPKAPSLLIFEDNPLYGFMFHEAVRQTYNFPRAEVTFGAFPLFFSNSNLEYNWTTNSGETSKTRMVTYRAPADTEGEATVSLRVRSSKLVTQDAHSNFNINFKNVSSVNPSL